MRATEFGDDTVYYAHAILRYSLTPDEMASENNIIII